VFKNKHNDYKMMKRCEEQQEDRKSRVFVKKKVENKKNVKGSEKTQDLLKDEKYRESSIEAVFKADFNHFKVEVNKQRLQVLI